MPKKHSHKNRRRMNGGFWPFSSSASNYSGTGTGSSWFGSNSSSGNKNQGQSSSMFGNWFGSNSSSYPSSSNSNYNTGFNYNNYGGKSRKNTRTRSMAGGYKDNTPVTGLATNASPFSGTPTAKAHNWVGGKTRRHRRTRKHHHSKYCKHRH